MSSKSDSQRKTGNGAATVRVLIFIYQNKTARMGEPLWEQKFIPEINAETTVEEMVARAQVLKKMAERQYGRFTKELQEMLEKSFYEDEDVNMVKEKRKEVLSYTTAYEDNLSWLETKYSVLGPTKKKEVESIDKSYKTLEDRRDAVRETCKEVLKRIDEWKNEEAAKRKAENSDNTRRRSRSKTRGGGDKNFKQPSGPAPNAISREFKPRQAQDWVNDMNLWLKGCSNLDLFTRTEQKTLCKKYVDRTLWSQVVFAQGDDVHQMIEKVHKSFSLMVPAFSRRIQFLNLSMLKGEGKMEWAFRLEQAAEMANLEDIQAQELKFLKYCQGLKTDDKLYDLLMEMVNPNWEKALEIIQKHEIAESVKSEIGDGKNSKHAYNAVSGGDTRAASQSPKRKHEREARGRDKNKPGGDGGARQKSRSKSGTRLCYNCDKYCDHYSSSCPEPRKQGASDQRRHTTPHPRGASGERVEATQGSGTFRMIRGSWGISPKELREKQRKDKRDQEQKR